VKTHSCAIAIALVLALAVTGPSLAAPVQSFPTAEAAAQALVDALGSQRADPAKLSALFGADWHDYVPPEGIDRSDVDAFLQHYRERHALVTGADGKTQLSVGKEAWIFPVPLTKDAAGWHFDNKAGIAEIRARRIGRNELAALQSVRAYHDAQTEYAELDRDGDGVLEYAQKVLSTDGKHDGLYWADDDSGEISPLGPLFGDVQPGADWHGYHFRILDGQGPSAPGGAYSYRIGDNMSRGFALVAWPAQYGESGVMSFMISQEGQVLEKDLGKGGDAVARGMKRFDPDASWQEVAADAGDSSD